MLKENFFLSFYADAKFAGNCYLQLEGIMSKPSSTFGDISDAFTETSTFPLKLLWPLIKICPLCISGFFQMTQRPEHQITAWETSQLFLTQFCTHHFLSVCTAVYIHLSIHSLVNIILLVIHPSIHPYTHLLCSSIYSCKEAFIIRIQNTFP